MEALDQQQRIALPPRKVVVTGDKNNQDAVCPCCDETLSLEMRIEAANISVSTALDFDFCPWCGERIEMDYEGVTAQ